MNKLFYAKKKSAICRLFHTDKINSILVNKQPIDKYFQNIDMYIDPIKLLISKFNYNEDINGFICNVRSGGKSSQSHTIKFAIGRYLRDKFKNNLSIEEYKEKVSLLRKAGVVTVDRRCIYPKIYGRKKANKLRQRSKR